MRTKELRETSEKELARKLTELRAHLSDIRWKARQAKLSNVKEIRKTREEIARIITIQGELKKSATRAQGSKTETPTKSS